MWWQTRRTLGSCCPQNTTTYQIIINTPEIYLKSGRTNSTNKGGEEATWKNVASAETWSERETDVATGMGSHSHREGQRPTSKQGEMNFHNNWLGK